MVKHTQAIQVHQVLKGELQNRAITRKKTVRVVYSGYKAKSGELLGKTSYIHLRNIQILAIGKFVNGLFLQIMNEVFNHQPHTLLVIKNKLYERNPETLTYETESVSFWAPKIWTVVFPEIKCLQYLDSYEKCIRKSKASLLVMQNLSSPAPCISESYIKLKLGFYFHTSWWCPKGLYEGLKGLYKAF